MSLLCQHSNRLLRVILLFSLFLQHKKVRILVTQLTHLVIQLKTTSQVGPKLSRILFLTRYIRLLHKPGVICNPFSCQLTFFIKKRRLDRYWLHHYLVHVIEQPDFQILNPQYLQLNFVYLIFCLIKSRTNSQQRHL